MGLNTCRNKLEHVAGGRAVGHYNTDIYFRVHTRFLAPDTSPVCCASRQAHHHRCQFPKLADPVRKILTRLTLQIFA